MIHKLAKHGEQRAVAFFKHVASNATDEAVKASSAAAAYAADHPDIESSIPERLENGQLPDVNLVGDVIFTSYNLPLQIVGVLLLVATIGVVVLSKRQTV